jgi:S1-C subfamily serine protease
VVGQLIERGEVARGFMGIEWSARRDGVVYRPEIGQTGVRVNGVTKDGPADAGGLQAGDIITEIAGTPVTNTAILRSMITSSKPGQEIAVRAWRDGTVVDTKVVLGELPRRVLLADGRVMQTSLARFGIVLREGVRAPLVAELLEGSEADQAGFKKDMVLLSIEGSPVKTLQDVATALEAAGLLRGKAVTVQGAEALENGVGEPKDLVITLPR